MMWVSMDQYLHHTSRSQLMWVFGLPPIKGYNFRFYFAFLTHSCLFHSPHLTQTSGPSSTKQIIFLTCTHIACGQVHPPQHTHALLTCVWEPPRFAFLCRTDSQSFCCDLSHACIGMFKILLLHPYYVDDLWTSFHCPDMGHHLFHRNWLTTLDFCLSYFLTLKNNEKIAECNCFLSRSLKYRKGSLHHLVYLLLRTM